MFSRGLVCIEEIYLGNKRKYKVKMSDCRRTSQGLHSLVQTSLVQTDQSSRQ